VVCHLSSNNASTKIPDAIAKFSIIRILSHYLLLGMVAAIFVLSGLSLAVCVHDIRALYR
jgi:hypothetical protein